jgi:transmembrane sensor
MSEAGFETIAQSAELVEARAADWLMRQRDCDGWNAGDQAALDAWLAQSPAHLIAYTRLNSAWAYADRLAALRSTPADVKSERRILPVVVRIAAALSVAAIVSVAVLSTSLLGTGQHIYTTPIGGHQSITLADGSRIELNTDTSLRTAVAADHRTVWLDRGEAYFQIKHDAARPFVVMAGDHRITDLGTEFSIRRDANRLEVALVSGRAWFDQADGQPRAPSMLLTPGDVVVTAAGKMIVSKETARALSNELGWRHGVLVFNRTALADVAAEFNRYNRHKLVVADPGVARITVGGTFEIGNVGAFADVAREDIGLHVEQRGDETVISR